MDSGLFTFTNHGCNGTYNIGVVADFDECSDTGVPQDELDEKRLEGTTIFNPFVDRHLTHTAVMNIHDIRKAKRPFRTTWT